MSERATAAPGRVVALGAFAALVGVVGLAPACGGAGPAAAPPPPSLVVFIIDTLRADALSCYGNPHGASPELDALAAGGVRFAHALAQSPWTRPSVASMLTSQHPRTLGVDGDERAVLDPRFTTLAEALRAHGYRTVGATANPHLNRTFQMDQGFDSYFDSRWLWKAARRKLGVSPMAFPDAQQIFRRVRRALDAEPPEQRRAPHYLQLNLLEVHEHANPQRWRRERFRHLFPRAIDPLQRRYLQALRQISFDVGAFVEALSGQPGFEDAIFAVVSDHGEGLHDHPSVGLSQGHGRLLYESQLRVPFLLYSPADRLPRGRVVEAPVRLLDLMPTLLDYAGAPAPEGLRGRSLRPAIEGRGAPAPGPFVMETRYRGHEKIGVYAGAWKYFEHRDAHPGTRPRELQATGREDGQRTDRAHEHPDTARELAAFLARWEREHPTARAPLADSISDDERAQLEALGYAD